MALTRSMLKGLELTDEQVSKIITAHTETVDGLKEVNSDLEKQLKDAKEAASKAGTTGQDWEAKYNSLNKELEDLKHQQEVEKEQGEKKAAYKSLLKEIGVDEKRINSILKLAPLVERCTISALSFNPNKSRSFRSSDIGRLSLPLLTYSPKEQKYTDFPKQDKLNRLKYVLVLHAIIPPLWIIA